MQPTGCYPSISHYLYFSYYLLALAASVAANIHFTEGRGTLLPVLFLLSITSVSCPLGS